MANDADRADGEIAAHFERALDKVQRELVGASRTYCIDCDEEIPADRRDAMMKNNMPCERCAECQTMFETDQKKGSR